MVLDPGESPAEDRLVPRALLITPALLLSTRMVPPLPDKASKFG